MDMRNQTQDDLSIFVNRRRFDFGNGAKRLVTGAELAALVGVPSGNAKIEREVGPDRMEEIGLHQVIEVSSGMHFLVTREFVTGGCGGVRSGMSARCEADGSPRC